MTRLHPALLPLAAALLLGCTVGVGTPTGTGGGGGTAGTGASGGEGGAGGQGGVGGGTGGEGATLQTHPGVLVDRGLVARYFLDEAASGQTVLLALDAAPNPLDLTIEYANDIDGQHMTYTEDANGNRGLSFITSGRDSRASVAIDGTKVKTMLDGGSTMTYEVVATIHECDTSISRLSHIGFEFDHTLSLECGAVSRLDASVNDSEASEILVDHLANGRSVLHMVVDTSQARPDDRVKLYVNGGSYPVVGGDAPSMGAPLVLGAMRHYVIGNREVGGRTIRGAIYYSAIYNTALSAAEVAQNAALLHIDDDATVVDPPQ